MNRHKWQWLSCPPTSPADQGAAAEGSAALHLQTPDQLQEPERPMVRLWTPMAEYWALESWRVTASC